MGHLCRKKNVALMGPCLTTLVQRLPFKNCVEISCKISKTGAGGMVEQTQGVVMKPKRTNDLAPLNQVLIQSRFRCCRHKAGATFWNCLIMLHGLRLNLSFST